MQRGKRNTGAGTGTGTATATGTATVTGTATGTGTATFLGRERGLPTGEAGALTELVSFSTKRTAKATINDKLAVTSHCCKAELTELDGQLAACCVVNALGPTKFQART